MIDITHDIYGERVRAEAHVDEEHGHVVLAIRHPCGTASRLHRADAVSLLRAMLREIAGPSIDDVREVWGVAHADMEVQAEDVFAGHTEATVCVWDGSRHRCFEATTLREALQAAYDAGVARKGGET